MCVSPDLLNTNHQGTSSKIVKAIEGLPYIAHSREPSLIQHTLKSNDSKNDIRLKFEPVLTSSTVDSLITFAKEGFGVALLPNLAIAKQLETSNLVRLLPDYSLDEKPIYAVHAYDTMPPRSVIEVIDAIRAVLMR